MRVSKGIGKNEETGKNAGETNKLKRRRNNRLVMRSVMVMPGWLSLKEIKIVKSLILSRSGMLVLLRHYHYSPSLDWRNFKWPWWSFIGPRKNSPANLLLLLFYFARTRVHYWKRRNYVKPRRGSGVRPVNKCSSFMGSKFYLRVYFPFYL